MQIQSVDGRVGRTEFDLRVSDRVQALEARRGCMAANIE